MAAPNSAMSSAYRAIDQRLKAGDVVILDGGIGSELQDVGYPENPEERPANFTWGSIAIIQLLGRNAPGQIQLGGTK